jgi:uncharacterized protein YjbJ (UPF0337 family)
MRVQDKAEKGDRIMNAVLIRGEFNQLRGTFKAGMSRLTGNNVGRMRGQMLRLFGKAQVKYGLATASAGKQLRKFTHH